MAKKPAHKKPVKPRKKRPRKRPRKISSIPSKVNLTPKQEKFCNEYLLTGNASAAYRQSYSTVRMKDTTINRKAKELMDNGKIAARIQELKEELKIVADISKERLLYELEAIATAKISDYVEIKTVYETHEGENGEPVKIGIPVVSFKDFSKLTDQQIRAIEGIKHTKYGPEITLHGKSWTTDRIAKLLGHEAPRKFDHTSEGQQLKGPETIFIIPANGTEAEED